jgi:hypothetical protein
MRLGARMMLWACCAGPAVAAMLVTGSGPANAAGLTPAGIAASNAHPHQGPGGGGPGSGHGPGGGGPGSGFGPGGGGFGPGGGHGPGGPNCDRRQLERWDVGGANTIDLTYNAAPFTYGVHIRQDGGCIRGTLTDIGIPSGPTTGPIFGTINGNQITFSFRYTYTGQTQGTRTFTGFIGRSGAVSGNWGETGPEHGHGTWQLASRADRACSPHVLRWQPWRLCPVHSS